MGGEGGSEEEGGGGGGGEVIINIPAGLFWRLVISIISETPIMDADEYTDASYIESGGVGAGAAW